MLRIKLHAARRSAEAARFLPGRVRLDCTFPPVFLNCGQRPNQLLQPLRKLAEGRAVVCVHHMRKSDGGDGTASRGSGALAGFVDVIVELRRASKSTDPHGVRRELKALGRMQGIPAEWLVELDPTTNEYRAVSAESATGAGAEAKREREDGRKDDLRLAIRRVLPANREQALTREEIWERLPEAVRVNRPRFHSVLEAEVPTLWLKEGGGRQAGSYRYWLASAS